jgi:hypothetical protein
MLLTFKNAALDMWPAWVCFGQDSSVLSIPRPVLNRTTLNPAQIGSVASPKGVFLQVWPEVPGGLPVCNSTGGVLVEMPKIPPGKTKA